jgi:two-component system chemotaxis sensor kinase CheA
MSRSAELRTAIDELALRLVIDSPEKLTASALSPMVEQIRALAVQSGAGAVAEAAGRMVEQLASGNDLSQSIANLQNAIELAEQGAPSSNAALAQDPELLADFVLESREHLATIESRVLAIERDSQDPEALHAVFRGFHTIKGLAGFLELAEVQHVAHEIEAVLDRARNGQLTITPAVIDIILEGADHLRRWLLHIESGLRNEPSAAPARPESLLAKIRSLSDNTAPEAAAAPSVPEAPPANAAEPAGAGAGAEPKADASSTPGRAAEAAMSVKVNTAKLDYLVDMAGEMVIAESLVRHDPELGALKSPNLHRKIAQLARITSELQKTAMAIRLVPIGPLFRRMARLVRDLARQFGKTIDLELQGEDIEIDRTIVEELSDPLMHMVRNAVDHGIETPDERRQAGKNPEAHLLLKAHHHAGQVVIEVSDDGKGLDRSKIEAKAIERGLISSAEGMSESEIHNLIFLPGFTTASQVTNVSGRGVGMDVVRRQIEKLRGRIEIHSQLGRGATFMLKLPLTLAIIDGLVVGVGENRYIVPLFSVKEMIRPKEDHIWTVQQRAEMALVRGTLLPVIRLYRKFHVKPRSEDPLECVLVVAETEGQRFCLLVDELLGKQEVVIKSLGETFRGVPGVAGGAILGDGRVGLILDVERLFQERER